MYPHSTITFLLSFILADIEMLTRLALLAPLLVLFVNGQCTAGRTDHFRCPIWVAAGFCNQTFYSDAQKQSFCGTACAMCPTTTCGVVYRGTVEILAPVQQPTDAVTPIATGNALTRVYVNTGCTLNLFTDTPVLPAVGTAATGSPFRPNGSFATLTGTAATAASLRCTCP